MSSPASDFALEKWYMDVADGEGNVYIGYWAALRWKGLSFHLGQHLWRAATGRAWSRADLEPPAPELPASDGFHWRTAHVDATWRRSETPRLTETLLETQQGRIEWTCLLPRAWATVRSPRLSVAGWGYVERLELTLPPWSLPLETLHWGRCLSDHHSLVWIRWDGPVPRRLLWEDGRRKTEYEITERGLAASGSRWEIESAMALRTGTIGATALRPFHRLLRLLPSAVTRIDERKSFARGVLQVGEASEPATAIVERVTW